MLYRDLIGWQKSRALALKNIVALLPTPYSLFPCQADSHD